MYIEILYIFHETKITANHKTLKSQKPKNVFCTRPGVKKKAYIKGKAWGFDLKHTILQPVTLCSTCPQRAATISSSHRPIQGHYLRSGRCEYTCVTFTILKTF